MALRKNGSRRHGCFGRQPDSKPWVRSSALYWSGLNGSECGPFSFSGHPAVYTIGPFLGYRLQFGNIVLGIEGDASYKKAETSAFQSSSTGISVSSFSSGGVFTSSFLRTDQFAGSVKQGWDYSIRGRIGTLITPWSLLYLTGGVAFGEISGTFVTLFSFAGRNHGCLVPLNESPPRRGGLLLIVTNGSG
jgi:opacity protein-like surface antigen